VLAAAALLSGCGRGEPVLPATGAPPTELIAHTFVPRPTTEDYRETVRLAEAGPRFILAVDPRVETPAEGPWTVRFRSPSGEVLSEHHGLRVDAATGRFTFVCTGAAMEPGDWTIELEVEPGGRVLGPARRELRFRVE